MVLQGQGPQNPGSPGTDLCHGVKGLKMAQCTHCFALSCPTLAGFWPT
jgi:hypothetical protein